MMLAILGMFVFMRQTVPFQEFNEEKSWRHPIQNTVGSSNPPSQFLGRDNDKITLSCELRPEITGGDFSIGVLDEMADTGFAWPLIYGTGEFMGSYVIESRSAARKVLMKDGKAKAITFSMTLKKVSEQPFGIKGNALGVAIGAVRALTGL